MNALVTPWYKRPYYSKAWVEHVARCIGLEDWYVFIHVEPDNQEVKEIALDAALPNKVVCLNKYNLGCNRNTHDALQHGFEVSDFVVSVEEDIMLSPDALRYFQWCSETYRDDRDIYTVSAYSRRVVAPENYFRLERTKWFTGWAWGTWRDRWKEMSGRWTQRESQFVQSWDWHVNGVRNNRSQIVPFLARCHNVGSREGTWVTPEMHSRDQYNDFWAGAVILPEDGQYFESKRAADRG
jgi:hypothetical protein